MASWQGVVVSVLGVGDVDDETRRVGEGEDAVVRLSVVDPDEELGEALEGPEVVDLLDDVRAVDRTLRHVVRLALLRVARPRDVHAEDGVTLDVDAVPAPVL